MIYEMPEFDTVQEAEEVLYEIVDAVIDLDGNVTMKGWRRQKAKKRVNGYISQFAQKCAAMGRRHPKKSDEREAWRKMANRMKDETAAINEAREKARDDLEWC